MKKIYIHIGFHKTGTSSIQAYLANNRDYLLANNYLYPRTGCIEFAHHLLAISVNRNNAFLSMLKKDSYKYWDDLAVEIKNSTAENIILSSEEFSNIDSIEKIQQINTYLGGKFEVKIIVYVRRIDSFCESIYKQLVKFYGSRHSDDFSLNANYVVNRVELFTAIKKWGEVFGDNNIIVKVFEKKQIEVNPVNDFLVSVGMDRKCIDLNTTDSMDINSSLSLKNNEILKCINKLVDLDKEQHLLLVDFLEKRSRKENNTENKLSYLSYEDRIFLIKKSSESDKKIARYFLNRSDGRLYFDEIPHDIKWNEEVLSANELFMAIVDVILFCKKI